MLILFLLMQLAGALAWSLFDFALAGVLLFGAGLAFSLAARGARSRAHQLAAAAAVGTALMLVWANLAVGIVGDGGNPANLAYLGVPAVLAGGALLARLRPAGMARALRITALAQAVVTAAALALVPGVEVMEVVLVNAFFIALWLVAAWLYIR